MNKIPLLKSDFDQIEQRRAFAIRKQIELQYAQESLQFFFQSILRKNNIDISDSSEWTIESDNLVKIEKSERK